MSFDPADLIHDWNAPVPGDAGEAQLAALRRVKLHDETLRDGIQDPSVVDPSVEDKVAIIGLMDAAGLHSVDLGIPGAGKRAYRHVLRLAQEVARRRLAIRPGCAARTLVEDIRPVVEVSQRAGISLELMTFIGASPIRQTAEDWSTRNIVKRSVEAIRFAVDEGLDVTFVTEDTSRSRPELLDELFRAAIDAGAKRLCLCDTVGHATPSGVARLVGFASSVIDDTGADVAIDWHGHDDRGLALANSLAAIDCGADRIHGCVLGIGERVGNASLDLLSVNVAMMLGELTKERLRGLRALCEKVSEATGTPIPRDYPVLGEDAFRTGTGVHAAAILKASRKSPQLADHVYSSVPAHLLGRDQDVCIGPMSGSSNVRYWLSRRGYRATDELVAAILGAAKQGDRNLTDADVRGIIMARSSTANPADSTSRSAE